MVSATPSYRSVRRAVFTLPSSSKLRTAPEFSRATRSHRALRAAFQRSPGNLAETPAGDSVRICRVTRAVPRVKDLSRRERDGGDISRPIPKHNRRSPKSGASSGRGVPPRKDLNADSTNHLLIRRDRKGDAQCHTSQSEKKIQAT